MVNEKHVRKSWRCSCGKKGMDQQEYREHIWNCEDIGNPVEDQFPEYRVCRSNVGTSLYMKAETEFGPFYKVWEDSDKVETMPAWDLLKDNWEVVEREQTPFPQFE